MLNPLVVEPGAKEIEKLVPDPTLVPLITTQELVTPGFQKLSVAATALVKSIEKTPVVTVSDPLVITSGVVKLTPATMLVVFWKRVHW